MFSLNRICSLSSSHCFQTCTGFFSTVCPESKNKKGRVRWTENDLKDLSKDELINEVLFIQKNVNQLENQVLKISGVKLPNPRRRAKKTDNFLECNHRHVALKVVYLGWKYSGLQSTANTCSSVEWILTNALKRCRLIPEDLPVRYSRSGRTDKHVSSFCQVLSLLIRTRHADGPHVVKWFDQLKAKKELNSLEVDSCYGSQPSKSTQTVPNPTVSADNETFSDGLDLQSIHIGSKDLCAQENPTAGEYDYVKMINSALPPDIRVVDWAPVEKSFESRRNCRTRLYHYYFLRGNFDVDKMQKAAQLLCGTHDFRNFCKITKKYQHFYRQILSFDFIKLGEERDAGEMYYAKITGSSFLHHQVRFMMTILFLIGLGKEEPGLILTLLDVEKTLSRPGYLAAPAFPLVLYDTEFANLKWVGGSQDYNTMASYFQKIWYRSFIEATLVKSLVSKLQNESLEHLDQCSTEEGGNDTSNSMANKKLDGDIFGGKQNQKFSVNAMYCRKMKLACSMNNNPYKKVMDTIPCKSPAEKLPGWKENSPQALGKMKLQMLAPNTVDNHT